MERADRVAVMNHGRVEQIGPPGHLYREPQTTFVAGFLGQMNRIGVVVTAGAFRWHGLQVRCSAPDGSYEAAVRPEDIDAVPDPQGRAQPVQRVDLGSSLRATFAIEGAHVRVHGGRDVTLATARLHPRRILLYRDDRLVDIVQPEGTTP